MKIIKKYQTKVIGKTLQDDERKITLEKSLLKKVRSRVAEIHENPSYVSPFCFSASLTGAGRIDHSLLTRVSIRQKRTSLALLIADTITLTGVDAFSMALLQETLRYFTEGEVVRLVLAVLAANDWHYLFPAPRGCLPETK